MNSYGFQYEHDGRHFAFDIEAISKKDAEKRLRNMAKASCIGMLIEDTAISTNSGGGIPNNQSGLQNDRRNGEQSH